MSLWTCDGIPKNGQSYPQAPAGGHPPHDNYGPDCEVCGLPAEAMESKTRQVVKTKITPGITPIQKEGLPLIPIILAGLLLLGGGWLAWRWLRPQPRPNTTSSTVTQGNQGDFVSDQAKNPQLFSQGERILLHSTPDKEAASVSFAQKDWQKAIADFTPTATPQTNDPEAKIYLYNAQARQLGNPLTVAVVVPLKNDPNGSKEILRGVAKFQEEFWQTQPGRALEIVIVNDLGGEKSREIAGDLEQAAGVLSILGHGIDPASQQAIRLYMEAGIPILSPLTTSITTGSSPQLKIISLDDKTNELLGNYLKSVGTTLAQYAQQVNNSPKAVVFYNSDSPYSEQLKKNFVQALSNTQGKVIQEIDTKSPDFNAGKAVAAAKSQGANTMLLAMSKAPEQITQAIALAEANNQGSSPLLLLGGNELYNPDILLRGGDNIAGLILAVPWSFETNDPFSQDAIKSWKGRVSWRTATAYDALKTLTNALQKSPERQGANQALEKGITLTGSSQNFNLFDQVPLVKAVRGNAGPPGSKYQFESLK